MLIRKAFVIEPKILHRAAMSDDPRSFGRATGGVGKALQDIGDGMDVDVKIAAVDELHLCRAFLREMHMSVGEPRNGRPAFEIDRLSFRAGEAANFVGISLGDDARTDAGEGFTSCGLAREGADFAVVYNQIGIG